MSLKTKLVSGAQTALAHNLSVHPLFKAAGGGGSPPAPSGDPYWEFVEFLAHNDGTDGSTVFVNSGKNTMAGTAVGNAQVDTAQSVFGGASYLGDGTGDYVAFAVPGDVTWETCDFTFEFWVRSVDVTNFPTVVGIAEDTGTVVAMKVQFGLDTYVRAYCYGTGMGSYAGAIDASLSDATWHHVAVERFGDTIYCSLDGTRLATTEGGASDVFTSLTNPTIYIGSYRQDGAFSLDGWIDEVRWTVGYARYQGAESFTVPTEAFPTTAPSDPKLRLLLHGEGYDGGTTFTDSSLLAATGTAYGNAQTDTAVTKFGSSSMLFDGDGDWVQYPNTTGDFNDNPDWTVDFWFYPTDLSSTRYMFTVTDTDPNYNTYFIRIWQSTTTLRLSVKFMNGETTSTVTINAGFALSLTTWHHIAAVYDSVDDYLYLYVNGAVVSSYNFAGKAFPTAAIGGYSYMCVGGLPGALVSCFGNLDGVRFIKDVCMYPAGRTFTVPTDPYISPISGATDSNFSSVSLLLPFNGSDGSTEFHDFSNNNFTPTVNGNTQVDTAIAKYGWGSGLFDGTGDSLSYAYDTAFDFLDGDFTFECFVRASSVPFNQAQMIFAKTSTSLPGGSFQIGISYHASAPKFFMEAWSTGGIYHPFWYDTSAPSANRWYHIAICRQGNTVYGYKNGVNVGAPYNATGFTFPALNAATYVGQREYVNTYEFGGWLDGLRLTKGVARYPDGTTFTPPIEPHPIFGS